MTASIQTIYILQEVYYGAGEAVSPADYVGNGSVNSSHPNMKAYSLNMVSQQRRHRIQGAGVRSYLLYIFGGKLSFVFSRFGLAMLIIPFRLQTW
jgi:hypothetical protein